MSGRQIRGVGRRGAGHAVALRIGDARHYPLAVALGQSVFHGHATVKLGIVLRVKKDGRVGSVLIESQRRYIDIQIFQIKPGVILEAA